MKVKGMIEPDVHASKVGDVIDVKLAGGVKVQAMAVQQEEDGMIFCLVDCLPGEYPMNSTRTNEGGYEESDLRKKLNSEILNLFPAELTDMMTPFDNGDLLRLPTEKEIFGGNYYGEYESPYVKQWNDRYYLKHNSCSYNSQSANKRTSRFLGGSLFVLG